MLASIVRFALRFRGLVVALAVVFLAYGGYRLTQSRYDVFPEFAPPLVAIQTEAPGLAPEQVELLVTQPIENAVNGVPGIESLRSSSIQGLSVVTVAFLPSTDVYRARQLVAERIGSLAAKLPQGVAAPAITPLTSSTSVVLIVGLTSPNRSLMELRTFADWTLRQRLLAVPGVAKVSVFGGEVRQLQIQLDPAKLVRYDLAVSDVVAAARQATGIRGAGFVDTPNQLLVVQTEGQSLTAAELGSVVLRHTSSGNVRFADLGTVVEAPEPPFGAASIMGQPGLTLVVSSQFGANTLEVTRALEEALQRLAPLAATQGMVLDPTLFRPASFVETAVRNVRSALYLGGILVVVVLLLFLFDLRAAAISFTAIPLSLLAGVVYLDWRGLTLNTMTIGGLAIAIGAVVDDAIIDVENILRRLRENHRLAEPRPALAVVYDACLEVNSAVVYATFAIALVFVPILTLSGVAGRLFGPLGEVYVVAILASLVVALTVTPALCLLLVGRRGAPEREPPIVHWLKARYSALLAEVERRSRLVVGVVAVLTLLGLASLPLLGSAFLPELREGHFIVHMSAIPGTSLAESLRIGDRVTRALTAYPFVRRVSQQIGRAEASDDVYGTHYSEINVDLVPLGGKEGEQATAQIRQALGGFPGLLFAVKTFLTERVEETLSGYTAAVVVNVFGSDLDALDGAAQEVARALAATPGATEVQVQSPPGTPQIAVRLRPAALARWGFDPVGVLETVRAAYQGEVVGQTFAGNRVSDVAVILESAARRNLAAVGDLPLRNSDGVFVRLRELADVYESGGRYVVLHEGARRVQTITCNVAGTDVGSFVAAAQRRIAEEVELPPGAYVDFAGTAAAQQRSKRDLLLHFALVTAGIVMLLSIVMGHWRNLLLLLVNLPLALVGGVLIVLATGGVLSVGAMVGFVTLFGITLRNSIMMMSHYQHLVTAEGRAWNVETAIRGAAERLSPILMTALVTALGLLPLALGANAPGREIEGPMALVILGGLATSTALNLLVLPTLALRFGSFEP
jgi:CzcA family heavy metal efflux pump